MVTYLLAPWHLCVPERLPQSWCQDPHSTAPGPGLLCWWVPWVWRMPQVGRPQHRAPLTSSAFLEPSPPTPHFQAPSHPCHLLSLGLGMEIGGGHRKCLLPSKDRSSCKCRGRGGVRVQRVVFPASPVPLLRPPRTFALHTWGTLPGGLWLEASGLLLSS